MNGSEKCNKNRSLKIGDLEAKIPVIQGGMGIGISLSRLAGSVAACGGIGVISTAQIGYREPDFEQHPKECNLRAIEKELKKARELANGGIIGVNIMAATRDYEDYVKAAVSAGADLIISGAGLPVDLPAWVKGSQTKIAPIVSTAKAAQVICKMWQRKYERFPDLVVIEGPRAGGHLGFHREELEKFTPEVYEKEIAAILAVIRNYEKKAGAGIPVVLAGGIYTREDMEHAYALGADGVQMGTRFVTTYECDASESYKEVYLKAKKEDIAITISPVGLPGRAICNAFLQQAGKRPGIDGKCYQCLAKCNPKTTPYCITKALIHAAQGDVENALLFCGDNAWRAKKLEHVADILKEFS